MGFIDGAFGMGFRAAVSASFLPAGTPIGWWDASQLTGLNDGDSVTAWADSSTNNYNLAEIANPPTYKTGIQNNLPAVRFDGTNVLDVADVGTTYSNENLTVHIVAKPTAALKGMLFAMHQDAGDTDMYNQFEITIDATKATDWAPQVFIGDGANLESDYVAKDLPATPTIYTVVRNGTGVNLSVWHELTQKALGTSQNFQYTLATLDCFRVGSRRAAANNTSFTGDIFEIVVYNSVLSTADRTANINGLKSKWNI